MSTFQVRVEDRVGVISDTAAISDWLLAGAKFITNILPLERLLNYTIPLTDGGSGISVVLHRVVSANKSGYGARLVPHTLAGAVGNSSSIHYPSATDPAYYILNGLAYVKPSGGTVVAMAYPTVAYGDSTITAFPLDLDEGVVLYACIQGRLRQMSDLTITTLGGLSISTFAKPIAPASPSFIWTAATYTDAVYSIADYVPALYANAEYTSAAYSAASAVDAAISSIGAITVSFSDTLAYNPPVFSGSYSNVDTALTNQDIELSNAHLNKTNTQLEQMQKDLLVSLNDFNKDKGEFDAALQISLTNAQLAQQKAVEEARNVTELNKFNEQQTLQAALVNAQKTAEIDLANRQAGLQLSLANRGKELEVALANAVQESQVDLVNKKSALELDITNKSKAMELAIINSSKELERQIQEYSAKLQMYGQDINAYSTEINQEVSRISQRINQYNAQFQQHSVGLEALRQEFQNFIKVI